MRRVLFAFAVVCLSAMANASVSVSGNLRDLTGTAVTSRTFVRFIIRGCAGNQARFTGTASLTPNYEDFTPDITGAFTGTLYDSLTEISCGGSVGATWYGVVIYRDGKPGPEVPYNVTGASFNLNSATPNTTNPVVAAPTGDSTYFRLDAGNIITGSPLPSGNGTQALGSTSARWDLFANDIDSNSYVKLRASSAPTCLSSIGFVWYDTAANAFKFCANAGSADFLIGRATSDTLTNKTLTSPTTTGTDSGAETLANKTITSPVINGSPTGTGIPILTLKKGTGAGNYTTSSTSYVDVDGTNLAYTVTIPSGWKLSVVATGTAFISTAAQTVQVALLDTSVIAESAMTFSAINQNIPYSLSWVITGDGASHTVKLQFKTLAGADAANIQNASATFLPTMVFTLSPSQ